METLELKPRVLPKQLVQTRDGVSLATDIYLPEVSEPRPVVVMRTPYGRRRPFQLMLVRQLNLAGLAVAVQDCRGRYGSQGKFDWDQEADDSYDTLAWLGKQEWTTGRVGLIGISISTYPSFLNAVDPPQGIEVGAIVSMVGVLDCYSVCYRNGALLLHWVLPWTTLMSDAHAGRSTWMQLSWKDLFRKVPLAEAGHEALASQLWERITRHALYDPGFWDRYNAFTRMEDLDVPTLYLCGWYDFLLAHSIDGFLAMSGRRRRPSAPQKLVLGPWNHQTVFSSFEPLTSSSGRLTGSQDLNLMKITVEWFRRWLEREPPPTESVSEPAQVLTYVMHGDCWLRTDRFPPPETVILDWFLSSRRGSATAQGDGRLLCAPPGVEGSDGFTYDPDDPVPTVGGAVWPFDPLQLTPGPADQSQVERRPDVLVYTSDPLEEDLYAVGKLEVEIWASTTAPDTDFTAKLCDMGLDGASRIVQDGIVRARFRESFSEESLLEPGRPYLFHLDLQATAYRFQAGHCLRLEISSSNFPKYDRNLNRPELPHEATMVSLARQTVFHGPAMPSRLRLTVLPREALERSRWDPRV